MTDDTRRLIQEIPDRTACASPDDEKYKEERERYANMESRPGVHEEAVMHLSEAITMRTVSNPDYSLTDFGPYVDFLNFLERTYPNVHRICHCEIINTYSPVYHWESDLKEGKPILFTGHYDVVPAVESSLGEWETGPFSGTVLDGCVFGRGALDDKNQVISIMEALEEAIGKGMLPRRDIYIAFGFDEEVGGEKGAKAIASLFKERNLAFEFVLDEGGAVIEGVLEGLGVPAAMIGVTEKGSSNVTLRTKGDGGHSSMPTKDSAIGTLSKVIGNIEDHPLPARLTLPVKEMFRSMAPYMGKRGFLLRHMGLTFPFLKRTLSRSATLNSLIRTTISFTMAGSGEAKNILPREAWANASIRILPGDTLDGVMEHMRNVNKGIPFEMEKVDIEEASMVSPIDSASYLMLEKNIGLEFPGVVVMPYLMAGSTDSRKYSDLCRNIYRFSAISMTGRDLDSIHSTNEKISKENLMHMVSFYARLLSEFSSLSVKAN